MDRKCVLILGGARSGKSSFAQDMAESLSNSVLYVATAEALDVDMRARIAKHQKERPRSWRTLEAAMNLADQIGREIGEAEVVLIDCLTLLVSNLMLGEDRGFVESGEIDTGDGEDRILAEIEALLQLIEQSAATFIIVSNELGLGVVPDNKLARDYRDVLGRINQLVAAQADEVDFMVAGIPMKVKG